MSSATRSHEPNGRDHHGARDPLAWKRFEGDRGGRAGGLGIDGLRDGPGEPEDGDRRARRRGGGRPDRGGGWGWRHGDCRGRHRRRPRGWARGQPPRPARQAVGEGGRAASVRNGAVGKGGRVDQARQWTFCNDHAGPHVPVQRQVLSRVPADRNHWWQAGELLRHRLSYARRSLADRQLVEPGDSARQGDRAMRLACGTLLLATAALTLALGATRVGAQTGTVPSDLRAWFKAADKNGDGRLDGEEFRLAVIEGFYFRDKERKGYLTPDQLPEASQDAFNAADVKHDGRLTLEEELNALLKDFEAADVDKDGTLTYEEVEAYVKRPSR